MTSLPRRWLDAYAILFLLVLYCAAYLPQVFISESIQKLSLPLIMSYAAASALFKGWSANPAIQGVVGSAALVNLVYPPGIFLLVRAAQLTIGDTVLRLNVLLFVVQALTPILCYLILRCFTRRLWALLLAWLITAQSVFVYTIPDFYNQVLILASLLLALDAFATGKHAKLIPVGILCALNAMFKQNIGLAWAPAVISYIFFEHAQSGENRHPAPRGLALMVAAMFAIYAILVTVFFRGWDNVMYYNLPFTIFWGWSLLQIGRGKLFLDGEGFLRDAAFFAVPFGLALGAGFALYAWNIGFVKYFGILFLNSLEDKGLLNNTVAVRGLIYYGTNGHPDVFDPRKLKLFFLWFAPFAANLWMALRFALGRGDSRALSLAALSITGVYTLFPLESFFNLQTKLCIPVIALAAVFSSRLRSRWATPLAAALLVVCAAQPFVKHLRNDAKIFAQRKERLAWVPGKAGIYMPRPVAEELLRSVDMLRSHIHDKFYIIGSSSGDMSMYYRLLDCDFANYYTDLREGYLNARAEEDLIRVLGAYPFVVVDKRDMDLWHKDPSLSNASLRKALGYVASHYAVEAEYRRKEGPDYAGLNDFYVMRRRTMGA